MEREREILLLQQQLQLNQQQMQQQQLLLESLLQKQNAQTAINSQNDFQTPTRLLGEADEVSNSSVKDIIGVKRSISTDSSASTESSTELLLQSSSETTTFSTATTVSERKKSKQEVKQRVNLFCERLTLDEFRKRLERNLSKEVLETQLKMTFKELYVFRESFIIPLSGKVPEIVDLKDATATDLNKFTEAYMTVFVEGCNVLRVNRIIGQPAVPDTKLRKAYRNFISNCWFILGNHSSSVLLLLR